MKIGITASDLIEKGVWIKYCRMTGMNEWAVNEGLLDSKEELEITEEQAVELGLIKDPKYS